MKAIPMKNYMHKLRYTYYKKLEEAKLKEPIDDPTLSKKFKALIDLISKRDKTHDVKEPKTNLDYQFMVEEP